MRLGLELELAQYIVDKPCPTPLVPGEVIVALVCDFVPITLDIRRSL